MNIRRPNIPAHLPAPAHTVRRSLALLCVLLGVTGCILPILPGLPFFVVAARLLGPRDRQLRRAGHQLTPHWRSFTRLMLGS